jgi:hypothetical protein
MAHRKIWPYFLATLGWPPLKGNVLFTSQQPPTVPCTSPVFTAATNHPPAVFLNVEKDVSESTPSQKERNSTQEPPDGLTSVLAAVRVRGLDFHPTSNRSS